MKQPPEHINERLFYLRRIFRPRAGVNRGLFDSIAWIDVVLLVILFIITQSATVKKPGLQVNLPVVQGVTGARYDAHVLTIPQDGVYFFRDQRVNWTILSDLLRESAKIATDGELVIEADESLTHGTLAGIYNLAMEAGWKRIVLATRIESRAIPEIIKP
ncbi:MAG TPA: biopolymer transporter ExbD [Kiritimatiellia bacterium]|nr:biopolymer transporter ExbD [Kiritimatiellia bacterium]